MLTIFAFSEGNEALVIVAAIGALGSIWAARISARSHSDIKDIREEAGVIAEAAVEAAIKAHNERQEAMQTLNNRGEDAIDRLEKIEALLEGRDAGTPRS